MSSKEKMSKDRQWNIDNAVSAESIAEFSYDYSGSRKELRGQELRGQALNVEFTLDNFGIEDSIIS